MRNIPAPELLVQAERYPIDQFRQHLSNKFGQALADNPFLGVITALAIGDKQKISERQWQIFTRTGTGHLMAISGLHIGLIAANNIFFHSALSGALYLLLTQYWPAPKVAALVSLVGAFGYALLAGWALPTQRALIMLMVSVVSPTVGKRPAIAEPDALSGFIGSLALRSLRSPLHGGFWLSFTAVAAILYCSVGHTQAGQLSASMA